MSEALNQSFNPASGDKEALKQKAAAAKDAVVDLASEATNYAAARAQDAKESAVQFAHAAKSKVASLSEQAVDCIQKNPYRAIAVAAGAGFVLGLLLKRR